MTPSTSRSSTTGNPNAACRCSRAAAGARGKFSSLSTSGMNAGRAAAQTRPGRPTPLANDVSRLRCLELGEPGARHMPGGDEPQDVVVRVHAPERAVLPLERPADRFQNLRHRFGEARRFRQHARRGVLRREMTRRQTGVRGAGSSRHGRDGYLRPERYSSSAVAVSSFPSAFFIRYALMNSSRSPSRTRLTSPTWNFVRWSLIIW